MGIPESGELTGRLLLASPALEDGTFDRAVVLVLDHDDDGALGVVLNRATADPVRDEVAPWAELVADPPVLFGGGPVEPEAMVALGRTVARVGAESGGMLDEHVRLVDLTADPVLERLELASLRIFRGYAGWAPGQLEGEIAAGAWFAADAVPGDVFTSDPEGLWHRVLRRQSGPLALLSTYPEDPTTN